MPNKDSLSTKQLKAADQTLEFYDEYAEGYARMTNALSMARELEEFAAMLPAGAKILDVGCGAGRDLLAFRTAGFDAVGIDLSAALAAIASAHSACEVIVGDFRDLPFTRQSFDGLWAAASLLHLERKDVAPTLSQLHNLLVADGAFFASVKAGDGEETTADGRRFTYFESDEWRTFLTDAGFREIRIEQDQPQPETGRHNGWIRSWCRA
jgi:SAM-dependent methyltransferase